MAMTRPPAHLASSPTVATAGRVVEFEIEGAAERLGVTEPLPILEKGPHTTELIVNPKFSSTDYIPKTNSPVTPSRKSKVKCEKLKVKGKRNGKVNGKSPTVDHIPCNSLEELASTALPLPEPQFSILNVNQTSQMEFHRPNSYIRYMETPQDEMSDEVEYDMEEEDIQWLELTNQYRKKRNLPKVKKQDMEMMMDRLEKESYFQMQSTGMDHGPPIDDDAVCCICMDGECQNSNAILFCDMCNLAVHQDCYGVPYIPEGQWLCRKCLHSPSRAVECVLCPNKGGALKGTDDGRWAHVACAIWIPEVCFANTVFLEPIESIANIPPARWRLTCFICKQKGIGACIQCYKSSCYVAFHVTCAQQANLVMKMETVGEIHVTPVISQNKYLLKKIAYCNNHAPPELRLEKLKDGVEFSSPRMKMKQTRKLLAEKRDALPVVLTPTIPKNRVTEIASNVNFNGKNIFMKRLMSYWKLKRQFRNGVPLLRRLQMASAGPHSRPLPLDNTPRSGLIVNPFPQDRSFIRLRQDLEKARLLCELIRKREKQKRELIYVKVKLAELETCPMKCFFLNIIHEIISRDPKEIFLYPVDINEVPDYLTRIKNPMDLTTMTEKVNRMEYHSLRELEQDFQTMIDNCIKYNDNGTIYYKTAIKLRTFGNNLFKKARKIYDSVGYNPQTGCHLSTSPTPVVIEQQNMCKCSNSATCNNNCKKIASPANMPASFTTYRSGGDTLGSDEDEHDSDEKEDDDKLDTDSASGYSSSNEIGEVSVPMSPDPSSNAVLSHSGDSNSCSNDSSQLAKEIGSEPELAEAEPAYPSPELLVENTVSTKAALKSNFVNEFNHNNPNDISESESTASEESGDSSESENLIND